ncbi:MAG: hypothetical protein IJ820_03125 [Lachnospiraceae bacterium]|nr:hypothetical protein [Lachnospiraceae bacterium]
MGNQNFEQLAVEFVVQYVNSRSKAEKQISEDDVYVVWMVKVLQNNKALLSTTVPDGMYYEFTWNGDKEEGYLDAYEKKENVVIRKGEDNED